jgi:NADH:ubiquinone oxidoreductase subunit F (NADH-binding)
VSSSEPPFGQRPPTLPANTLPWPIAQEQLEMTLDTEIVERVSTRHHLLGQPRDLAGHIAEHGRLPIPRTRDRGWEQSIVERLRGARLLGRGGAAFPSSIKLASAQSVTHDGVIVVNGMEGEPASDKDKVLLSRVPHLVLDGAQVLAAASGASRVVVCVPVGRDAIAFSVENALAERRANAFTRVPEVLVRPPDRFVAGEESALARWISDEKSLPGFRTDKSIPLRIGKSSALVHNAETLAHIGLIARRGPDEFLLRGTPEEPGTMLVTVTGAVQHPGVVEIDRGTPLDQIVSLAHPSADISALLVGGYGGSWIARAHFSVPYSSVALRSIGVTPGVGVIVALGAPACGIAETARLAQYMAQQSSGQCGPCVFGLPAIAGDLALLARGHPDSTLVERLTRRLGEVDGRGACRHPDGLVTLVRSALQVFSHDVVDHAQGKPCATCTLPTQLRFPDQRSTRP